MTNSYQSKEALAADCAENYSFAFIDACHEVNQAFPREETLNSAVAHCLESLTTSKVTCEIPPGFSKEAFLAEVKARLKELSESLRWVGEPSLTEAQIDEIVRSIDERMPKWWTDPLARGLGVLQVVGSGFEVIIGGSAIAAPDLTLVTKAFGGAVVLHGIDGMWVGIKQIGSGKFHESYTVSFLEGVGIDPTIAVLLDIGFGVAGPLKLNRLVLSNQYQTATQLANSNKGSVFKLDFDGTITEINDIAELEKLTGMRLEHIQNLSELAQQEGWTIVFRASNPESLRYQGMPGFVPKGYEVKLKTGKAADMGGYPVELTIMTPTISLREAYGGTGLVVWPKSATYRAPPLINAETIKSNPKLLEGMSDWEAKETVTLLNKGYTFNKGILETPDGKAIHGDYDGQGIFSGTVLIPSNKPQIQRVLNKALIPEVRELTQVMCQHGCNDNFFKIGTLGKLFNREPPSIDFQPNIFNRVGLSMGRQPGADEDFILWTSTGGVIVAKETKTLQAFYGSQGIRWPYQSYVEEFTPAEIFTTLRAPNGLVPYLGTETEIPNELIPYLSSEAESKD
jgi:hypothetical protein